MKAKKALKRLRRVEELLSVVIDEFVANELSVRKLLDAAKKSVIRAKAGISSQPVPLTAKKPRAKVKRKRSKLDAEGRRKKMSLSSKERPTVAKRSSKVGAAIKMLEERDTTKSRLAAAPMTGSSALEGSQEDRHAN